MAIDFKLLNALTKARRVYGDNYLIDLAIEEMGELIVALNHHRRKRVEASAVQEEIADVMLALKELQQIFGTGHHAVVQKPGTDEWYIVYHRFQRPRGAKLDWSAGYNREVCIDRLTFDDKGNIIPVKPTL